MKGKGGGADSRVERRSCLITFQSCEQLYRREGLKGEGGLGPQGVRGASRRQKEFKKGEGKGALSLHKGESTGRGQGASLGEKKGELETS